MASKSVELDKAIDYELQLSEHLQQEIIREYKSLDILLERYEKYRQDDLIQQSSFFEYYEMLDEQIKKKQSYEQDNNSLESSGEINRVDLYSNLPLMPTSGFLDKVGKAFAKLPQSDN